MNTLVALCALGAEKILANELKVLGYKTCGNAPGRVSFLSDDAGLYKTNLCLRTADRVYLQLGSFFAQDFDRLFDEVERIQWQDYFKKDTRVVVDKVRVYKSQLSSEHSIQSLVHKAIYTKLGKIWNMSVMPESGAEANVRVYMENDTALILLDLSGDPLHKRGYRTEGGPAPIRETLAAVLIQIMCWRRKTPFHDAFCGSGTIPIEAALFAYNIAPGFGRKFALENLAIYNRQEALEIKKEEAAKIRPDALARITGTDIDKTAIERARINAEHACVTAGRALQLIGSDEKIQRPDFEVADFKELTAPYEEGLILSNLPFGERLGDEQEAKNLYKTMPSLFTAFPGWEMGFITSHAYFEQFLGIKAHNKKELKSGNLNTFFYRFTINTSTAKKSK